MRTDIKNDLSVVNTIAPAAHAATVTGTGVDLANYDAAAVVITAGAITDGTHTLAVQDSADNSTFTAVSADFLDGTAPVLDEDTTAGVTVIGYHGVKRYLRVVSTVASGSTGGVYQVSVIRGKPRVKPTGGA